MALLDAKEYDPRPAQRKAWIAAFLAIFLVAGAFGLWWFRFWPEEHAVNRFFEAIEHKDFDAAYGIYFADPAWKQHAAKYSRYPLAQFMRDWGPDGDFGMIASHKTDCAAEPPKNGWHSASGVIVVVTLNSRQQTKLWVEKADKTITLAPDIWEVRCRAVG